MSTGASGAIGYAPGVLIQPVVKSEKDHEQEKYRRMWEHNDYRNVSPGEHIASTFLQVAKPRKGEHVIDFGTGTGRGALMLALFGNLKVTMVDFAENCLDEDVRNALSTQSHVLNFVQADLRQEIPVGAKYGFCTDVMEHLPPESVDAALINILRSAQHVFFQISTVDDHFGFVVGESLHLTVRPFEWWKERLLKHDAVIHWSAETENAALFYVSSWMAVSRLVESGTVNTDQSEIAANIKSSIARGLKTVSPHVQNNEKVLLLAGGPSLNDYVDEIREKRAQGYKVVTTNGTYNWCLEHGISVSAQVIVDARESNKKFIPATLPDCKYFIASQCHPAIFDAAPADQTYIWHSALDEDQLKELNQYYTERGETFFPVIGGSTVILRAIPLMFMLGFNQFEIYGFDSCLMGGEHHAYAQEENDSRTQLQVICNGTIFYCHPWMASQAQEFMDLVKALEDSNIQLVVHGDGLIAHIIKSAVESDDIEIKET